MMRATADARLRNRAAAKVALLNVTFGIEALSAHLESRLALGAGNGAPDAAATRTRERWRLAITKVRSLGVAAGALALGTAHRTLGRRAHGSGGGSPLQKCARTCTATLTGGQRVVHDLQLCA